jgi:hypothetical protein
MILASRNPVNASGPLAALKCAWIVAKIVPLIEILDDGCASH